MNVHLHGSGTALGGRCDEMRSHRGILDVAAVALQNATEIHRSSPRERIGTGGTGFVGVLIDHRHGLRCAVGWVAGVDQSGAGCGGEDGGCGAQCTGG